MSAAFGIVVTGAVVTWQLYAVSRSRLPQLRAVEAAATTATLVVLIFASTYLAMSSHDPATFSEPFDHTASLYFTMTTVLTVGYGDLVARSDVARIAVIVQMVVDVAILGVSIRLLANTARTRLRRAPT